ncbi:NADP-dependent oxidoreductase domain-containing protein [Mycena galopus ATCC 62051]|nr:NADP-dependent oxidoreductase domain-containing protein [Mycena galopus ATCC 62051]
MSVKPVSNVGVVFGAMLIGAPASTEAVRVTTPEATTELLDIFQKHGHTEVDTARMYTGGTSEEMLGVIGWQERGLKIQTKIFPTKGKNASWLTAEELTHSPADLRKGLKNSLAALKTEKVDIYYLHAPDRSVPYEDTLREINNIYLEGAFARFGLSNYPAWEVAQICEICKRNGWVLPTVYQGIYNALHRGVEPELIPCLRAYGISFYVYNPLAGGFLTSRYTRDQSVFDSSDRFNPDRRHGAHGRMRYWNEPNFKALDLLRPAIAPNGITESEAALRWLAHHSVLRKELGDAIIIGVGSKKHLEENLDALDKGPLPDDVVVALDAGWEETRTLPLTGPNDGKQNEENREPWRDFSEAEDSTNNFLSWQVADQWQCSSPPSHLSTPFPAVVGLGVLVAMLITLAADRARVADLDAEILHLERSLSALRSQRQLVLERLDYYKYPVLALPNEITAEIFTHFLPLYPICPPLTGLYSPILFTQICRQWREIALETPILWRAISLSDSTIPFNAHISVWLERSRYCPLSLHFDDDDPISGELLAAEVLAAIVPHRARWDHLTISLRLPTLLHAIEGPMPLLRRLNLSSDGESDTTFSLGEAPLLRSVTLNVMTP